MSGDNSPPGEPRMPGQRGPGSSPRALAAIAGDVLAAGPARVAEATRSDTGPGVAKRRPSLGGGIPAQGREVGTLGRQTVRRLLEAGLAEFDERGFQAVRVDETPPTTMATHRTVIRILSQAEIVGDEVYGDGLRLLFRLSEAIAQGMTAARAAAPAGSPGPPPPHAELTALACLMMLERINYLMSVEVRLPREEMIDRLSAIIYAAFHAP